MFPCPTGESHDVSDSVRYAAGAGDSVRYVAGAGNSVGYAAGNTGESVEAAGNAGDSVKAAGDVGASCGHSAHSFNCEAGDVAPDVVSSRHAVSSTCFMVHDGLGGGASKLCSDRSKTLPSAVGTNLFGNFNASVARFASSAVTVMLSCAGQGTSKRFKCLRHSSKHASVCAGARKYSCAVCKITGAAPCGFRSGAKM